MGGFPSFGGDDDDTFDEYDEFVPDHVPDAGPFLEGHDVLAGEDHLAFHEVTREVFEQRGVYDMTFGYNLARLNLDTRHPGAGYRYAREADDEGVVRAEFTPTTPFCPQSDTLTKGSFRAWNGLADDHDYDLVKVRIVPMHQASDEINADLQELEADYLETGQLDDAAADQGPTPPRDRGQSGAGRGPDAPF